MSEPLVVYDFNPYNLPPEYLQAVGLVVTASSQTESVMQYFIGALLGIDNVDTIAVAAHMSAPLKDQVIRTLIELKTQVSDNVDDVDDLLDAVKDALDKRNVIVHNALAVHPDTGAVYSSRIKARGSLQADLEPVSVEEIHQAALLIYDAGMNIANFMIHHGLDTRTRTKPLMVPLNRRKKARERRREDRSAV